MLTRVRERTATSPFYFNGTMSEEVLRRYAARAVTHQMLCIDDVNFDDDMRMIQNIGAKFIGRAAHFSWKGDLTMEQIEAHYAKAAENAERVHALDPDIILQAGVFEIIYKGTVEAVEIPDWVWEAFGLPAQKRHFCWEAMLFPAGFDFGETSWGDWGSPDFWGKGAAWPFIGQTETQMYLYYCICRYIDCGFEAIHLGQAEKSAGGKALYNKDWDRVTTLAREYAETHARRGVVLFDCHTIIGGSNLKIGDRLLLDIVGAGMVPIDTVKEDGVLKCKICDCSEHWCTWIGRSEGGEHPLGFTTECAPTIVEFDNYGRPGPAGVYNDSYTPWGYDDITWFALQPEWYRNAFLLECDQVMSGTCLDSEGRQVYFLQPPLRRNLCCDCDEPRCHYIPGEEFDEAHFQAYLEMDEVAAQRRGDGTYTLLSHGQYRANNQSDACPNGFGQEDVIKRIFAGKPY